MADLILKDTDPDALRAAIVADVLAAIGTAMQRGDELPKRIANRPEMARFLSYSLATLDRRTREGVIPSILDGDRRMYVIDDVLNALREGTAAAEAQAAERQKAKQDAKKKGCRRK
jgi:hypothetical protein